MTHIWFPTLFPSGIIIFQGLLTKFHFSTTFPYLEKIVILMKDLKHEHQSTFPLWGRVKLNFKDRYGKPNFPKLSIWCKIKIITHSDGFVSPIYGSLEYSIRVL